MTPDVPTAPEIFVVCCTEMHVCTGPFADAGQALAVARSMTESSAEKCVYVPVPLVGEFRVMKPGGKKGGKDDYRGHPGQYL